MLATKGSLLARKAQSLKDDGLKRVTVSLEETIFKRMNDAGFPVSQELHGLDVARHHSRFHHAGHGS